MNVTLPKRGKHVVLLERRSEVVILLGSLASKHVWYNVWIIENLSIVCWQCFIGNYGRLTVFYFHFQCFFKYTRRSNNGMNCFVYCQCPDYYDDIACHGSEVFYFSLFMIFLLFFFFRLLLSLESSCSWGTIEPGFWIAVSWGF